MPRFTGKSRDECTNKARLDVQTIKDMMSFMPMANYSKNGQDIFAQDGGAAYVAGLAGYCLKSVAINKDDAIKDASSIYTDLTDWLPKNHEDPVYIAGLEGLRSKKFTTIDGQEAKPKHFLAIAQHYGFPAYNFKNINEFIYVESKQKFMSLYGTRDYYSPKVISQICQPVQIEGTDLWVDADEWGRIFRIADSFIFDPNMPFGILFGKTSFEGKILEQTGSNLVNLYHPPFIKPGNYDPKEPEKYVKPLLAHIRNLFSSEDDVQQILMWMAHIIQKPGEKVRWAPILYSKDQGVGKDVLLNFIEEIIGSNYCSTIKPSQLSDTFNEFARSIMIRISEVSDVSERMSKRKFQEEVKTLISGDSQTITINPKYGVKYSCQNIAHVVITTNNLNDIIITSTDRRYDVFECRRKEAMGIQTQELSHAYFSRLINWYQTSGKRDVYAFLLNFDISKFNIALPRLTMKKIESQESIKEEFSWVFTVIQYIAQNQAGIGDNAFCKDTFTTVAKYLATYQKIQWTGPNANEAAKIDRTFRLYAEELGYEKVTGGIKDGRFKFSGNRKTYVYRKKDSDFEVHQGIVNHLRSPSEMQTLLNTQVKPDRPVNW